MMGRRSPGTARRLTVSVGGPRRCAEARRRTPFGQYAPRWRGCAACHVTRRHAGSLLVVLIFVVPGRISCLTDGYLPSAISVAPKLNEPPVSRVQRMRDDAIHGVRERT